MSQPIVSARVRKPATGRDNRERDENDKVIPIRGKPSTEKFQRSSDIFSINNSIKSKWNDTLRVGRQFSPRDPFVEKPKKFPPIFPRSTYPTVPPYEQDNTRKRPLACTQKWLDYNQSTSEFDRTALEDPSNAHIKLDIARDFVERNRDKLWQFDHSFYGKTPRSIAQMICDDSNFLSTMDTLFKREKFIELSSSNNTKECLSHPRESLYDSHPIEDHHITSLTTTRTARERKLNNLLQPAVMDIDTRYHRGYDHAPEYGNFSKFNSLLKSNAGAVLKR